MDDQNLVNDFFQNISRWLDQFLTPAVKTIFLINVVIFLALNIVGIFNWQLVGFIIDRLAQYPALSLGHLYVWQFLTYMFVQVGVFHILFNMMTLWFFAPALENRWGSRAFWKFYLTVGVLGAVAQAVLALTLVPQEDVPIIGASGAIMGVLLAYAAYRPNDIVIFFVFPMKVKYLVILLCAIAFFSTTSGREAGVSNLTHLCGLGVAYVWLAIHHRDWDIRHWQWTRSW